MGTACCGGMKGLGEFIPGNRVPAYIESRIRVGGQGNWIVTPGVRGLGVDFGTPLIAGIPNWALLAGGGVILLLMMKR